MTTFNSITGARPIIDRFWLIARVEDSEEADFDITLVVVDQTNPTISAVDYDYLVNTRNEGNDGLANAFDRSALVLRDQAGEINMYAAQARDVVVGVDGGMFRSQLNASQFWERYLPIYLDEMNTSLVVYDVKDRMIVPLGEWLPYDQSLNDWQHSVTELLNAVADYYEDIARAVEEGTTVSFNDNGILPVIDFIIDGDNGED